jgi:hypothetical protein
MPWEETENEIRHRVKDPSEFQSNSFRRITIKRDRPQVFAIIGRLKGQTTTTVQAFRFPKDQGWTIDKAKSWVKEHAKTEAQIRDAIMLNDGESDNLEFLAGQPISSINHENRTVNIIFFSGIDVARMNFWTGEKYILRFDPNGSDLSFLNNGAPVLDNHLGFMGATAQKGVVERAWAENGKWMATLRFSKRPSVDELWQDIQDRIVTKFSMGVEILESEKQMEGETQILLAKSWRPFELSVAPIPADFGTTTLAAQQCGNSVRADAQKETAMSTQNDAGISARVEDDSATVTAQDIYDKQMKNEREMGVIQELARVTAILDVARILNLSKEFADKHIRAKTPIDKFRELAIEEQSRIQEKLINTRGAHVELITDEQDTRRELMGSAMFGMMSPKEAKPDKHNPFIGLSVKQIAEESVYRQCNLHRRPSITSMCELAMQTTADFANVLENVARKQLLRMYELAAPSYKTWTKRSTTPDFKNMTRVRLGEAPTFLKIPEGGQITIGAMTDQKETYSLATYGRGVSFTRQMLINDDLGAFNDLIGQFGMQAARLENKTVYAILTTNALMADGVALFDDAHGNHGAGVLGNTGFDAMFSAMGIQKGIDGVSILNIQPRFVIVPKAKESTAKANLLATGPNLVATSQNWFAGRLEPVADGELDATSTAVWYGAADPAIYPGIEYCYLEGAEGPQFIRKENENGVLGIQFYAYLDFAAKAVDWRPLYYSTGA